MEQIPLGKSALIKEKPVLGSLKSPFFSWGPSSQGEIVNTLGLNPSLSYASPVLLSTQLVYPWVLENPL